MAEVDRMIVELNETFHRNIQEDFQPYLEAMRSGDLSFLEDPREAAIFYKALSVQYARTNHIKKAQLIMEPERLVLLSANCQPLGLA
jgi:DNA phosphorothioation-dependent restriction protein DptG